MKLDEYSVATLPHNKVQIMFTEPLTEGYELSVFMEFFKKYKKKISLEFKLKPVQILGLICEEKYWVSFLKKILADKVERAFLESVRELKTIEEVEAYLLLLRDAEMREREKMVGEERLRLYDTRV